MHAFKIDFKFNRRFGANNFFVFDHWQLSRFTNRIPAPDHLPPSPVLGQQQQLTQRSAAQPFPKLELHYYRETYVIIYPLYHDSLFLCCKSGPRCNAETGNQRELYHLRAQLENSNILNRVANNRIQNMQSEKRPLQNAIKERERAIEDLQDNSVCM